MESCIYSGRVRHRRFHPVAHEFSYPIFMLYLDLEEAPELFRRHWIWSDRWRWAPASFLRRDHAGDPSQSLSQHINGLVEAETGAQCQGPIRVLTHLRYFGHYFSPVNLFFCFEPGGEEIASIVAEVTNTPWKEKHSYVLSGQAGDGSRRRRTYRLRKAFHVSPFMPMDIDYRWRFVSPKGRFAVQMESFQVGVRIFDASMALARREITTANLLRTLANYPAMSLQVVSAIHFEAMRLWVKKAPFHPHPDPAKRRFEVDRT